ncbi:unnamed protein product [Cuscuta campestris]|uniref:CCHC-type domain-containing protein n=1 Tax=Cuscuta campestris TaxID=132261 RepID=A0A484MPA7_9ASTE|nr:unnamed protein product [Cuscuta campestris]
MASISSILSPVLTKKQCQFSVNIALERICVYSESVNMELQIAHVNLRPMATPIAQKSNITATFPSSNSQWKAIKQAGSSANTPKGGETPTIDAKKVLDFTESGLPEEPGDEIRIEQQAKPTYAEILTSTEVQTNLSFYQFEEINGKRIAMFTDEDVIEEKGLWDNAVICYILGANPALEIVKGFIARIWKGYTVDDVSFHKEGQYIVMFQKPEDRDEIVKRKYYYFDNKSMLVQRWSPGKQLNIQELSDVPIWVQFPNLDMRYWSLSGLGKLGSILGKPIKRDRATATRAKWSYARIQIEVQVQQEFPDLIHYVDKDDRVVTQEVVYEWRPSICSKCGKLGHLGSQCRKKEGKQERNITRKVWRPKEKEGEKKEMNTPVQVHHEKGTEMPIEEKEPVEDEEGFQVVTGKKRHNTKTKVLNEGVSDHSPLLIKETNCPKRGGWFRFCNMWMEDPKFIQILQNEWKEDLNQRSMYQIVQNSKRMKVSLRKLHKDKYRSIHQRVDDIRDELMEIQGRIRLHSDQTLINKERDMRKQMNEVIKASRQLKCQQVKLEWITAGDKGSKMFFAWAKKRQLNNYIMSINDDGREVEGTEAIAGVLEGFYIKMLGTTISTKEIDRGIIESGRTLTIEQQLTLVKEFQAEQVISKMICTRLKEVVPHIVNLNQSAFVKGRELLHNVLLCQELAKGYKRKGVTPRYCKSVSCIMNALEEFQLTTGLRINRSKSEVVFGGISHETEHKLLEITNMKEAIMKLNWDIADKKGILWVRWIHARYIKGDDFWSYKPKQDSCHYWKEMTRVKEKFTSMPANLPYTINRGTSICKAMRDLLKVLGGQCIRYKEGNKGKSGLRYGLLVFIKSGGGGMPKCTSKEEILGCLLNKL